MPLALFVLLGFFPGASIVGSGPVPVRHWLGETNTALVWSGVTV